MTVSWVSSWVNRKSASGSSLAWSLGAGDGAAAVELPVDQGEGDHVRRPDLQRGDQQAGPRGVLVGDQVHDQQGQGGQVAGHDQDGQRQGRPPGPPGLPGHPQGLVAINATSSASSRPGIRNLGPISRVRAVPRTGRSRRAPRRRVGRGPLPVFPRRVSCRRGRGPRVVDRRFPARPVRASLRPFVDPSRPPTSAALFPVWVAVTHGPTARAARWAVRR